MDAAGDLGFVEFCERFFQDVNLDNIQLFMIEMYDRFILTEDLNEEDTKVGLVYLRHLINKIKENAITCCEGLARLLLYELSDEKKEFLNKMLIKFRKYIVCFDKIYQKTEVVQDNTFENQKSFLDHYLKVGFYGLCNMCVMDINDFVKIKDIVEFNTKPLNIISTNNKDSCCICLNNFNLQEPVKECPHCKQSFHTACVEEWLTDHVTCPHCRQYLHK